MKQVKIGVIADDFTGASDAASLLYKRGIKTLIQTSRGETDSSYDAIVMAIKSRSVDAKQAIKMSKEAVDHLLKSGCTQIYFKYCSTFDSTPQGNIGVVLDFLVEYLRVSYTVLCPSMPVNGRTVLHGNLYVYGEKLEDSHMKYHPLNPMWNSNIPILMKDQSKYQCFVVDREELEDEKQLKDKIVSYEKTEEHFYLIPDYEDDADAKKIATRFKHLPFLSGGSSLLEFLVDTSIYENSQPKKEDRRSIILCGSCSAITKKQIICYSEKNGILYKLDIDKMATDLSYLETIKTFVCKQKKTVLIYSMDVEKDSQGLKEEKFEKKARQIEKFMAKLAKTAVAMGFQNIVVAGGETSGAVVETLGYSDWEVGESIDPGVPALYPLKEKTIRLVLKSGNFGSENFFEKATQ